MRITKELVESLWYTRKSNAEIQSELGVTVHELWMIKKRFGLPRRSIAARLKHEPDAETITQRCLEVQADWTPEVRERRRVGVARLVRLR
jgi:hypothetical protein